VVEDGGQGVVADVPEHRRLPVHPVPRRIEGVEHLLEGRVRHRLDHVRHRGPEVAQGPQEPLAVARAALREPDLPAAQLDGAARGLRLLVDHREDLVAERTRLQNRLRWHLHELFPGLEVPPRGLRRLHVLDALAARLVGHPTVVAAIARELVARCRDLTLRSNELEREIARGVCRQAPALLALAGCGALTAAKLVGEVAGAGRFRSRAAFARWNGTAPIPVWSGSATRFRLNRGGNRQVNAALHRIAITQYGGGGPGRAYVERRLAAGDHKTEALRLLSRRLSDEVYRRLCLDAARLDQAQAAPPTPLTDAA
jgi:transposase